MTDTNICYYEAPEREYLIEYLQQPILIKMNEKLLKKGKLLLFKRNHYFIQLSLQTEKHDRENIEVPFPFSVDASTKNVLKFDYRLSALKIPNFKGFTKKAGSIYFNNVIEIQAVSIYN
jgi:hypothetical protein